jgi:hypothetical protein
MGTMVKIMNYLGSLRYSLAVILFVTLACIAGTLIPQGSDVVRYLNVHPSAGKVMDLLVAAGFTHVFSSLWFIFLLCLLSVSLVICTARRYASARKLNGMLKVKAIASTLTHVSFVLVLAGAVIRGVYGENGSMSFREGETMDSYISDGGSCPLPFSVYLQKFEVETYDSSSNHPKNVTISSDQLVVSIKGSAEVKTLPVVLDLVQAVIPAGDPAGVGSAISVTVRRKVLDFVIDTATHEVSSRSDDALNPAILVDVIENNTTNSMWLFARYPDFSMGVDMRQDGSGSRLAMRYNVETAEPPAPRVKGYKSTLKIIEGQSVVKEAMVEVNAPFTYKGYTFYQSGFNPGDPSWTSLQVVRDPGVILVYAGFLVMIIGMMAVFGIQTGDKQK